MLTIMVCGPHNQHVNNSEQQCSSQTVPLLTKNHIDCNFNDGMDVDQFLVSFTFLSWKCYQIKSNILGIVGKTDKAKRLSGKYCLEYSQKN